MPYTYAGFSRCSALIPLAIEEPAYNRGHGESITSTTAAANPEAAMGATS
jgi:hypothetical protein